MMSGGVNDLVSGNIHVPRRRFGRGKGKGKGKKGLRLPVGILSNGESSTNSDELYINIGKGKGKGKPQLQHLRLLRFQKRRKIKRDVILGITKGSISRLARRGGVKRMSGQIFDPTRSALRDFLTRIIRDAVLHTKHRFAQTCTLDDVLHSLKFHNAQLYGCEGITKPKKK